MIQAMTVPRGDTLDYTLTFTGNWTGWTPRLVVKASSRWADTLDAAAVLSLSVGSGLTFTPGLTTTDVGVLVSASVTATLDPGVYVWDLQLSLAGDVRTVEWDAQGTTLGSLTVSADVTRTTP